VTVDGRPVSVRSSSDAEIFFTSVFGLTAVLLANELLFTVFAAAAAGTFGPALLARTAPLTSVLPLYAFFVLLPAGLAFFAIGVPFLLRTIVAVVRGRLAGEARWALVLFAACVAAAVVEVEVGHRGVVAVSAAALLGAWLGRRPLATIGDAYGFRLLAAAGLSVGGLAWYEHRTAAGAATSIAIAPTLVVAGAFFALVGLATTTAAALRRDGDGRAAVVLGWLAVGIWLATPLLRARIADSALAADSLETASVAAAALILTAVGVVEARR